MQKRPYLTRNRSYADSCSVIYLLALSMANEKKADMSCPYFRDGYVGICIAFELMYIPSIARMGTYCFNEDHRLCPSLTSYMPETFTGNDSHKDVSCP